MVTVSQSCSGGTTFSRSGYETTNMPRCAAHYTKDSAQLESTIKERTIAAAGCSAGRILSVTCCLQLRRSGTACGTAWQPLPSIRTRSAHWHERDLETGTEWWRYGVIVGHQPRLFSLTSLADRRAARRVKKRSGNSRAGLHNAMLPGSRFLVRGI